MEEETRSHLVLRYEPPTGADRWEPSQLPAGQPLRKPKPLFRKLEESIIGQEIAHMTGSA